MKCLAIETATWGGSIALLKDEAKFQYVIDEPRQQTQQILPYIDSLLTEYSCLLEDLDCIAISIGPGSFTGLRVGVSVVQSIAWAQQLPVVAVSTLRVMAQTASRYYGGQHFAVGLNAYMQQLYLGLYQVDEANQTMIAQQPDRLMNPSQVAPKVISDGAFMVGDAWRVYQGEWSPQWRERLKQAVDVKPQAYDLLTLAQVDYYQGYSQTAQKLTPVYLRQSSAWHA